MNIWQNYKQERDCLVHTLRLLAVCWPGAQSGPVFWPTLYIPTPHPSVIGAELLWGSRQPMTGRPATHRIPTRRLRHGPQTGGDVKFDRATTRAAAAFCTHLIGRLAAAGARVLAIREIGARPTCTTEIPRVSSVCREGRRQRSDTDRWDWADRSTDAAGVGGPAAFTAAAV